MNGRIVPLHYRLQNGDFVEILTSKQGRGPSRDWMALAKSSRARNKIRQWFTRETREDQEHKGREALEHALKQQNLPYAKLRGSAVLAQVIRDSGFKKAEDFYLALGSGRLQSGRDRQQGDPAAEDRSGRRGGAGRHEDAEGAQRRLGLRARASSSQGVEDVLVRLAKCCTPVPGDPIVGYISLGKGITIHRERLPERQGADAAPRSGSRRSSGTASGRSRSASRSRSSSWDRPRLLEDVARTFAEHGANIVSYGGVVEDQLAKNWYTAEVGDVAVAALAPERAALGRCRVRRLPRHARRVAPLTAPTVHRSYPNRRDSGLRSTR